MSALEAQLAGSAAAGASSGAGLSVEAPATLPEEAASATSGPPIITTEDDDPATNAPQVIVPAIDLASPAKITAIEGDIRTTRQARL